MNFSAFLSSSKIASIKSSRKVFVLGNESGDLDSIISSLTLAYLEQLRSKNTNFIPLLNIHRNDLSLRGEVCWALSQFSVDERNLVFISDVDLQSEQSNIILVDHNALSSTQGYLSNRIVGIYDHHKDEGLFLHASPRVIETVGSCCTLILLEWINSEYKDCISKDISGLMLGTILMDTVNLEESFGRTTLKDKKAAGYLFERVDSEGATDLFKKLQIAKNDVLQMCSRDLLRKDFKKWIMEGFLVGISSVTWSLSEWKKRDLSHGKDWLSALNDFTLESSLDILCIMTAYTENDVFWRELYVYVPNSESTLIALRDNLKNSILDLILMDEDKNWLYFRQNNIKCSRKQVQPLLSEIISELAKL